VGLEKFPDYPEIPWESSVGMDYSRWQSILYPHFKEVLRRENQGLKVYSIDGSSVFSMTGTYF
jgi:hypothetical protein